MKIEIDPVRIIRETRLEKHVFTLSHCELEFIVKHKTLKAEEKLLWLLLASMSAEDENFSCSFSIENLSAKMEISSSCLVDSLQQLEAMGFLNRYSDNSEERCSLSLPNAGLLSLRLAAKREAPGWLKKMRGEANKDVYIWWG
jgi:hypothetical protein